MFSPSQNSPPPSSSIYLQGSVERITFHSPETRYAVFKVMIKNNPELITVIGVVSTLTPGENIECSGRWVEHLQYGKQFETEWIRTIPPSSLEGIEKYLGSGMVKGIGPHFASKLVECFGFTVFDVIEKEPEKLKSVPGLGKKRMLRITSAWQDQKMIRSIMIFLQSHGVSSSKAVRIFKTYGASAVEKIQANPYQLARDIHGIGFLSADHIAEKLGIAKDSEIRARAGLTHVLLQRMQEGHCAYPEDLLLKEATKLLDIPESLLITAIALEIAQQQLTRVTITHATEGTAPCLALTGIMHAENEIACLFKKISQQKPSQFSESESIIRWAEQKCAIQLAPLQYQAIQCALQSSISIITGGPGTGKSTLTQVLCMILKARGMRMALCAPTGRAAQRLSECTGLEAKTIHRTLGLDVKTGQFLHHAKNPLAIDVLLIDESSMLDLRLMHHLMKAIPSRIQIILIGDVNQLPSVGPGQVLKDLIDSQKIPTVHLHQIFRQAAQSQIIQAAHQIHLGQFPQVKLSPESDFHFIESENPEKILQQILELVQVRIPRKFKLDPLHEIQVLTPMLRGTLGARNLNLQLQKTLNPNFNPAAQYFGHHFAVQDKVIVIQNDYDKDVFNGDLGFIQEMNFNTQECTVHFSSPVKTVVFPFDELDLLQPAYSITIHKSQGSEYPAVIIPITTQHFLMLTKKLIYTGITRGKKLVVLIGQKKALYIALRSLKRDFRWTHLHAKLNS